MEQWCWSPFFARALKSSVSLNCQFSEQIWDVHHSTGICGGFVGVHHSKSLFTHTAQPNNTSNPLCHLLGVWKCTSTYWSIKLIQFKRVELLLYHYHIWDQTVSTATSVVQFQGLVWTDMTPAEVTCQFFRNQRTDGRILHAGRLVSSCILHMSGASFIIANVGKWANDLFDICFENKAILVLKALTFVYISCTIWSFPL